jgi:ribosomal protein L31E
MSDLLVQQQDIVEGLRYEAKVQRLKVSQTAKELVEFVRQHMPQDPFLVGIDKKSNHFIEKSSCDLL